MDLWNDLLDKALLLYGAKNVILIVGISFFMF